MFRVMVKNTLWRIWGMPFCYALGLLLLCGACRQQQAAKNTITVQEIVDAAIVDSGGEQYKDHTVSFRFRDRLYESALVKGKQVLRRTTHTDSITIVDEKRGNNFYRIINDSLMTLHDTLANRYANAVNSVHYFSRLPYGLNAAAVHKQFLDTVTIKGQRYFKVKVTFDEFNGGDDFEDVYLYWFNIATAKPDYLAYSFAVNGGGMRFREAFNERYVGGIRFVDYNNYKPLKGQSIDLMDIAQHYERGELELLSKIAVEAITVAPVASAKP
ncbi:MAG: DUF6503 family protein [Bacteroidota bacterium]